MGESPRSLVGYCGLYCGACGIRQGRVKQAVENLRKVLGAYGFDKITPELAKWEPAFQHYAEYEKVLDGFVRLLGECPGCVSGGGDPNCALRECSKKRGYATCADCPEMDTCVKLKRYRWTSKALLEIRAEGADRWAKEMERKVSEGFCYLDEKA